MRPALHSGGQSSMDTESSLPVPPFPRCCGSFCLEVLQFLTQYSSVPFHSSLLGGHVYVTSESILFISKHISFCLITAFFLTTTLQYLHSATKCWKLQRTTEFTLYKCLWTGYSWMGAFHSPSLAGLPITYWESTVCVCFTILLFDLRIPWWLRG